MALDTRRARALIDGAVGWLDEHALYFDPQQAPFEDRALPQKMLLELVLMCMVHRRLLPDERDRRIDGFIDLARRVFRRDAFRHQIVRQPHLYRLHGLTALALLHCGAADDELAGLVGRALGLEYTLAIEELPYRDLERRLMAVWLGPAGIGGPLGPDVHVAYRNTLAARVSDAVHLTDHDAYAITHTLFYLGHFGMADAGHVIDDAGDHVRLCRLVETLLGVYLRRRHLDLVGELVLSCHCLRWYESPLLPVATSTLLDQQHGDGHLPGPHFSSAVMAELPAQRQRPYFVKHNYHTTLVAILAFVALLAASPDRSHREVSSR
jgi:hypothetical protein